MRSNVNRVLRDLDEEVGRRLEASGIVVSNAYKDEIREAGLVDTGRWISSVTYSKGDDEVKIGTPVEGYPFFLEVGFRHWRSGEIVGPYRPLTKAASNSEGELRRIWNAPIRG